MRHSAQQPGSFGGVPLQDSGKRYAVRGKAIVDTVAGLQQPHDGISVIRPVRNDSCDTGQRQMGLIFFTQMDAQGVEMT